MIKVFRNISVYLFSIAIIYCAEESLAPKAFPVAPTINSSIDTLISLDETRNRFPEILSDAKFLMSEVLISDFNKDTLEVTYILSKIFELLMEADQMGEMNLEDKEEFDRFNRTFTNLYTLSLIHI